MGRPHKIEGTLNAMPYIRKLGVTPENLIYKFDFRDSRFIFLWSGNYDYCSPSKRRPALRTPTCGCLIRDKSTLGSCRSLEVDLSPT
jgi:hypothetical protein